VKYNDCLLFLYPLFRELTYRSDCQRIFALDGSNDVHSSKGVPFGGLVNIAAYLWVKSPKALILGT